MVVGFGILFDFFLVFGVCLGIVSVGIKKSGCKDVVVFELVLGSQVVGIFICNQFCVVLVILSCQYLVVQVLCYLLINIGNVNVGIGECGMVDVLVCCIVLVDQVGVEVSVVFLFLIGVIGELLLVVKIVDVLFVVLVGVDENCWVEVVSGIMIIDI